MFHGHSFTTARLKQPVITCITAMLATWRYMTCCKIMTRYSTDSFIYSFLIRREKHALIPTIELLPFGCTMLHYMLDSFFGLSACLTGKTLSTPLSKPRQAGLYVTISKVLGCDLISHSTRNHTNTVTEGKSGPVASKGEIMFPVMHYVGN